MLGRLEVWVAGVADPPPAHLALVDPRDREPVAVGCPPVAACALQLLRSDEVGDAPGRVAVTGDHRGRPATTVVQVDPVVGDVRDAIPVR